MVIVSYMWENHIRRKLLFKVVVVFIHRKIYLDLCFLLHESTKTCIIV